MRNLAGPRYPSSRRTQPEACRTVRPRDATVASASDLRLGSHKMCGITSRSPNRRSFRSGFGPAREAADHREWSGRHLVFGTRTLARACLNVCLAARPSPRWRKGAGRWRLASGWLPAASAPAGNGRWGAAGGAPGEKVATANCQLPTPHSQVPEGVEGVGGDPLHDRSVSLRRK